MSAPPTPSLLSRLRPYLPVALVATLGLTVTALGVRILLELEGVKREAEFRRLTVERVRAIEHSFDLYVGDLHATLGLFYASETVERDEFVSFVTPIVRDRPALRAVEWVKRVADAERDAFEREARAIYREFAITELAADGKLVRAARCRF